MSRPHSSLSLAQDPTKRAEEKGLLSKKSKKWRSSNLRSCDERGFMKEVSPSARLISVLGCLGLVASSMIFGDTRLGPRLPLTKKSRSKITSEARSKLAIVRGLERLIKAFGFCPSLAPNGSLKQFSFI